MLQAADLARPPTQLELETELATPGKSGRHRSSSSRGAVSNAKGGDRGLEEVRNELYSFQDSVKGELSDMKAIVKQLLDEVRKRNGGGTCTPPSSSQVGTTGPEDSRAGDLWQVLHHVPVDDPIWTQKAAAANPTEMNVTGNGVTEASPPITAVSLVIPPYKPSDIGIVSTSF